MRLNIRRETEMGRYHNLNLLTAEWIETMMNNHHTDALQTYREIRDTYLLQPIY